jgi:hypothetical protein
MLANRDCRLLLERLCVELGFCLPPDAALAIAEDPPGDIEAFVSAVFQAEGLDAQHAGRRLHREVRDMVQSAFHDAVIQSDIRRVSDNGHEA